MSLTTQIKEYALDAGYSKVGIIPADGFPEYISELTNRHVMYSFYIDGPSRPLIGAEPRLLMPTAKSIITLVYDYSQKNFPEELTDKIGRIFQSRCYNAPPERINGARPKLMREFLRKLGCEVGENVKLPERLVAANRDTLKVIDLDGLKHVNQQIVKTAVENKVFENGTIDGYMVVAIDGTKFFGSNKKSCSE